MAVKPRQQTYTGKSGVEYTLQYPGARGKAQIIDNAQDKNGKFSLVKLQEELMKHVIVNPKVNWDYLDSEEGMQDADGLIKAATEFLMPSSEE